MTADTKTVVFDPTGRIRIYLDETHTLRNPKYGEFRKIKDATVNAQTSLKAAADALDVDLTDNVAVSAHPELMDTILESMADAVALAFEILGDKTLPEDRDEWPTWLVLNTGLLSEFIAHWRAVPLASGR